MSFIAFLVAATILAITPGPGIAYVVARTVAGGRSEGLASRMGTGLGGMLHVLAAAHRLLASGVARAARARLMTRISGATMIGLGVFLATAKRQT